MHKYKTDLKKYWKSEGAKYKSISIEIKQPERADLVDCVLAIMVLDVNFNNPSKAADFLFFDEKVDAKKIDNNVVKVKGCLIHVHEDIKNLSPFPSTFLQLSRPKRGFWARRKGTCWPPESEPA